jgi:DNA-binding NarL/FixJ family response regulator
MSATLNIALADDQALVREGMKAVINGLDNMTVGFEADNGQPVLDALSEGQTFDVVVSDIRMPGMDGIALAKAIGQLDAPPPVLLLTTFDESDLMLRAVEAGAKGFLLKDIAPEDLQQAIQDTAAGKGWLQPVTTRQLQHHMDLGGDDTLVDEFSDREMSILRLMAGGYSNREIARSIFLAEGTVKNYVSDILNKLHTRDRTRAVLKAITLKLI